VPSAHGGQQARHADRHGDSHDKADEDKADAVAHHEPYDVRAAGTERDADTNVTRSAVNYGYGWRPAGNSATGRIGSSTRLKPGPNWISIVATRLSFAVSSATAPPELRLRWL